jgi:hypothetical protein
MKKLLMTVTLSAFFGLAAHANPITTLFNSLGDAVDNPPIIGTIAGNGGLWASFSTLSSPYLLNDVMVDLQVSAPSSGVLDVELYADDPGVGVGTELDLLGTINDSSLTTSAATYSFTDFDISLNADTRYWIGITSVGNEDTAYWDTTEVLDGPEVSTEYVGGPGWEDLNAAEDNLYAQSMEIDSTPEPSTILLGVIGIAMLVAFRRRVAV